MAGRSQALAAAVSIAARGAALAAVLGGCAGVADKPPPTSAAAPAPAAQAQPAAQAPRPAPAASAAPPRPAALGNAATVEAMPQVLACTPTPRAVLMGSGPGQELYTVICANGYGLLVQCTAAGCKVMN